LGRNLLIDPLLNHVDGHDEIALLNILRPRCRVQTLAVHHRGQHLEKVATEEEVVCWLVLAHAVNGLGVSFASPHHQLHVPTDILPGDELRQTLTAILDGMREIFVGRTRRLLARHELEREWLIRDLGRRACHRGCRVPTRAAT